MENKMQNGRKSSELFEVVEKDLRSDYGVDRIAETIMEELETKVSPILYGMLIQQLLALHEDMQLEMDDNLVLFARSHVAHFTGCPSADMVLDSCYIWIGKEHKVV